MNPLTQEIAEEMKSDVPCTGGPTGSQQAWRPDEPYDAFLERYRQGLRDVFSDPELERRVALEREFPESLSELVRETRPLSACIPGEYGGRGGAIHEFMGVLGASSYESLALSLVMGINGGLFLQPLSKYGNEGIKREIFRRFIEQGTMGGLMITEPDFGSDALSMMTCWEQHEDHFTIRGTKHWAGLTGMADYWIVAARRCDDGGDRLGRDVDFFVCDARDPKQRIEVIELYNNLGLYIIPYGLNRLDLQVPLDHRFESESSGIRMMLDMLYRSRAQFAGMAIGYLRRVTDEAIDHCRDRFVGGQSLLDYDQVQHRLSRIQAAFTTCSAMCTFSSENAGIERDLYTDGVPHNSVKAVVTDLMQEAAQSLVQLTGGTGFRLDHIAGRSLVDSRPFQIFEGSNDILYQQISESVMKSMRRVKESNLYSFLKGYDFTARASESMRDLFDFELDFSLPQRRLVELGQILGRVLSMEMTIELGERGFRQDLVAGALTVLREDVEAILASYRRGRETHVVEDYAQGSSWMAMVGRSGGS
jgi:alkylation response protein AidB-like acyl-CoA dehydrogenase